MMSSRSVADVLSEDLDGKWLSAKADPRASVRTPVSEVCVYILLIRIQAVG
jgi:hypothetical protein